MSGGVIGDPYVTRLDDETFAFGGEPGARYTFLDDRAAGVKVLARVLGVPADPDPPRTYVGGIDLHLAGETHVFVGLDGQVHVFHGGYHLRVEAKHCTLDAPGHFGNTRDEAHPLQGVAHLNLHADAYPGNAGVTGILADGTEDTAERYRAPG